MVNSITGGFFFRSVFQGRDITVHLPREIPPALAGLPPGSSQFTGRDAEVRKVLRDLAPNQPSGVPPVAAVVGPAGVGKTELVLQVARRALEDEGWFPGGVLFVNLFGYDDRLRLSPEQALDDLLRALGILGEQMPEGLQGRSRLFRSVLAAYAKQGKRVLVIVDNVSSDDQAEPLLPATGTAAALITSRHSLNVGSRQDLDVLPRDAAVDLVRRTLHHAGGQSDTRVDDDPLNAVRVAELCDRLPLALQTAAAMLADFPARPLASLADALADARARLGQLERGERGVRAAFRMSYERLSPPQARLFRLLSLNPGPDMGTEAAAQLAGADPGAVEVMLQDLARAHLIKAGPAWGRWLMHDLMRLYASERDRIHAERGESEAARRRLLSFYAEGAESADTHLNQSSVPRSERFRDQDHAVEWLDAERQNLMAAVIDASAGNRRITLRLSLALGRYLLRQGLHDDWLLVSQCACEMAQVAGDDEGKLAALHMYGTAQKMLRRGQEARATFERGLTLARRKRNRASEALLLNALAGLFLETPPYTAAVDLYQQAIQVYIACGDRHGEAVARSNLGMALRSIRRFRDVFVELELAADIWRDLGDHKAMLSVQHTMGNTLCQMGRLREAIALLQDVAERFRELGELSETAMVLTNLCHALLGAGKFDETVHVSRRAVKFHRQVPASSVPEPAFASALTYHAYALYLTKRDMDQAAAAIEEALDMLDLIPGDGSPQLRASAPAVAARILGRRGRTGPSAEPRKRLEARLRRRGTIRGSPN
ncbi:tetratricopeptide repeat protein [Streptomyces sp. NPDC088360]|uniref:tetratricopeptide repeat protein n=1 Tax=Streptomyces sp. NPDC088360 TaxID=3154515 RepID=UPI00344C65B8